MRLGITSHQPALENVAPMLSRKPHAGAAVSLTLLTPASSPFFANGERRPQTPCLQQAAVSGYNLITSFPCIYF